MNDDAKYEALQGDPRLLECIECKMAWFRAGTEYRPMGLSFFKLAKHLYGKRHFHLYKVPE